MPLRPDHRKLVKHPHQTGFARELTFCCYRKFPLLGDCEHKNLLTDAINRAVSRHFFDLVAFVYMPEHVHLIVFPRSEDSNVSALLAAIKKPCSFRIKQRMLQTGDPQLGSLTIRERPGHNVFRFWQEGTGYDRDIVSSAVLRAAIEYLHENPVRRGLAAQAGDWPWSSWHHYHQSKPSVELPVVHGMPEGDLLS